ncbi:MAG: DUF7033 domain-containing protein [Gaiellales bacterium]
MSEATARVEVDAPAGFQAKARWAIETLLAGGVGPAEVVRYPSSALPGSERAWEYFAAGESGTPAMGEDGLLDFGDGVEDVVASAFWHLSRWEERPGSARDDRGRFPASAALADPQRPVSDALARRLRRAVGAPDGGGRFTVALTHDVDTPRRWYGRRALLGAAGRARRAGQERRRDDLSVELRGLAAWPVHRMRGTDPNWVFQRIREIEAAHGGRSTYFVMAGHTHPADGASPATYDRARPAVVRQVLEQGDELGLHPSYEASERPELIGRQADRLAALAGEPVAGVRFHSRRHQAHGSLAELDRLGFAYDSSQGFAERPGLRAGLSHPYRPYDLAADRPLRLLELPLAVMDATLAERRYMGLTPEQGLRRAMDVLEPVAAAGGTVAVLWHNDRFDRVYGRGWDWAYDRLLAWVVERGGWLVGAADAVAGF